MKAAVKYACLALGCAGLLAAYGVYSTPMHLPFVFTLTLACLSALLLLLGLTIHVSQSRRRS